MKKTYLLLLPALLLASCGGGTDSSTPTSLEPSSDPTTSGDASSSGESSTSEEQKGEAVKATYSVESLISKEKEYEYEATFDPAYFDGTKNPSNVYNKNLEMFSFHLINANRNREKITQFYNDLGFTKTYVSEDYEEHVEDQIGVSYAYKHFDATENHEEFDLVMVSLLGFDYGVEWAGNFTVGDSGNHEGFEDAADYAQHGLVGFLEENEVDLTKVKLLIAGYSRGGAVANYMGYNAHTGIEAGRGEGVEHKDVYCYTFEAPAVIASNYLTEYNPTDYIYNIRNVYDLVPNILPDVYGFGLAGTNKDMNADYEEEMKKLDEDFVMPAYNVTFYNGEERVDLPREEFIGAIHEILLTPVPNPIPEGDEASMYTSATNRAEYNENLEATFQYAIGYVFGLSEEARDGLIAYAKDNMFSLFGLLSADIDTTVSTIKTVLDANELTYDDAKVTLVGTQLARFLKTISTKDEGVLFSDLLSYFIQGGTDYILVNHAPETVYCLLNLQVND